MGSASPMEIGVLLLLLVLMFGPEKVPEMARKAARVLHYLRGIANNTRDQLRSELGPEFADLDYRDLNPKVFVRKHLLDDMQDDIDSLRSDLSTVRSDLNLGLSDLRDETPEPVAAAATAASPRFDATEPTPFDTEAT